MKTPLRLTPIALAIVASFIALNEAPAGTLVSVDTPVGSMTLELEDDAKPNTVTNFLTYLSDGRYQNLFSHRLDDNFVLQTGGFTLTGNQIAAVPTDAPIASEFTVDPRFSNTYGTIAMAKLSQDPDSATSQWFINLADNLFLDSSNGGFTVFGRVVAGFDTLAKFNTDFVNQSTGGQGIYDASGNLGPAFEELPLLAGSLNPANFIRTNLAVVPESGTLLLVTLAAGLLFARHAVSRPSATR